ncbi:MAG: D-TA family PLP-dependent enzyme [Planctomycetes bacterium]|nr:D-TA family PLP-dependent enzyme [Planctomycetota bacterium]
MSWYHLTDPSSTPSPALLVYRQRVVDNIQRMVAIAQNPNRLRPHVKTHKMAEVVALEQAAGIDKFKCATIAEAEMTARCGAADVLISYPQVGPNIGRLVKLAETFPDTRWSVTFDNLEQMLALDEAAAPVSGRIEMLLDLDVGMHRTGVAPDETAVAWYRRLAEARHVRPGGLHLYDGHIRQRDVAERRAAVDEAFAPVAELRTFLKSQSLPVPRVVAGGSFSFPIHAHRADVELSPGTTTFWDRGYGINIPDLPFEPAVMLLTRVVSRQPGNQLCLDLGYKAVSADQADGRVYFPDLPDARMVGHSEEHLVVESAAGANLRVGDVLYGMPWHVCPTVALHAEALVVHRGQVIDRWAVAARDRRLTI